MENFLAVHDFVVFDVVLVVLVVLVDVLVSGASVVVVDEVVELLVASLGFASFFSHPHNMHVDNASVNNNNFFIILPLYLLYNIKPIMYTKKSKRKWALCLKTWYNSYIQEDETGSGPL